MDAEISQLTDQAKRFAAELAALRREMKTVIVGQDAVIDRLIIALCADGHVLLEGVPGIAKTLTIRTLSQCIDCSFVRLQFTPGPAPRGYHRDPDLQPEKLGFSQPSRARSLPISSLPTRSTGRRPRSSPPSSRRCRRSR